MLFVAITLADGPLTFNDYKQLSKEERQQLLQKANPELKKQYNRWDRVINIGVQCWSGAELGAILQTKGLSAIGRIDWLQNNIWGNYMHEVGTPVNPGNANIPKKYWGTTVPPALAAEFSSRAKEKQNDDWYLVNVIPTPEALKLNNKASAFCGKWQDFIDKYPRSIITKKDLAALDADVQQIRDELRKLPLWTQDQVEEAFAALPDLEKHSR